MNKEQKLEIKRHSLAHILASAVLEMFPEAKFGVGPNIENGFYYDFDLPRTLIPEDLPILQKKMIRIINKNYPFEKQIVNHDKAIELFKKAKQDYKVEILNDEAKDAEVSLYRTGEFVDLCRGPHVDSTGEIDAKSFKLTKIAGAYWRGDEKNKMLQRIYGVAFNNNTELKEYQKQLEEAEKRDHKKLGRELDLFSFHPEAQGSAFWHPRGMIIWNELEKFGKSIRKKYGSEEIQTPQLAKKILWETSGHWNHYKEDMFYFENENETYCLKPMDCPFNIKIYQTKQRSYKELPIRYTEIGRVMRNEKSGQLNGLFRVRAITQDDAHIFVLENQIEEEISLLLKMVKEYYKVFNIEPEFFLSTRPENFMGEIPIWDKAEKNLINALEKEDIKYGLKEKDGAFYGPKIDINIKDALERSWQLATIQLDFQLPQRFNVEYIDENGDRKTPVLIHAAIFGSLERFIGIIIEHTGGNFPLWLSPVQVKILPVSSEKHIKYAEKLNILLLENNIRSEIDDSNESINKKIREAEKQKNPYMLVVGDKESASNSVAVRSRGSRDIKTVGVEEFIEEVRRKIENKL
ncbi:MAG: threonine--tRNA ligase [Patescibacteria group bacterium]|nr:threonine--tRNA ligase [Patescibacteria group bacterium]